MEDVFVSSVFNVSYEYDLSVYITTKKECNIEELVIKIMEALHDGEKEIVITPKQ
jgi:hypothetical protein